MDETSARELVEDLFRRESARLVSALVRLLGPSHVALAEDVVHDALVSAMQAWRFSPPDDPRAWILRAAKNRAIDLLRRDRRFETVQSELSLDEVLSPAAEIDNQLAMMFAICDDALAPETHVTLILRLLCGLSPPEIARAFLVDVQTIDRRLHRGRSRLQELGQLDDVAEKDVRARQPSVERALYLLFNEGYLGSDPDHPLHPAMCAEAIRLVDLLLEANGVERATVHALGALFCFHAARLCTRVDGQGVLVPLAEQDRSLWDRALIARGIAHLGESASGDRLTRWHLEAGIAFEHTGAPSVAETNWPRIVELYDALIAIAPGPVVALNRALAVAEVSGVDAGKRALVALESDPKLASYSFYFAARADLERRSGDVDAAKKMYRRAVELAKTQAERVSYERRVQALDN